MAMDPSSPTSSSSSINLDAAPAHAPEWICYVERHLHIVHCRDGTREMKVIKRSYRRRSSSPSKFVIETKMLDEVDNGDVVLLLAFDVFRLWRREKKSEEDECLTWRMGERNQRERILSEFMNRLQNK